jgi:hypothetical protein
MAELAATEAAGTLTGGMAEMAAPMRTVLRVQLTEQELIEQDAAQGINRAQILRAVARQTREEDRVAAEAHEIAWQQSSWASGPALSPAWIHAEDERLDAKGRQWRSIRCDGCGSWERGNNSGCFVKKQPTIKAGQRLAKYHTGEFNATWYCVACLTDSGYAHVLAAMLKRQASRQHYIANR